MKTNLLKLRRVLNATLFVLLFNVVGMTNALGQTQVATLQHGDDISVFYGTNAFVEAHTAAADGDIITLSSGTFVPTNVTKAITLRGTGCAFDTITGTNPTIMGGLIVFEVNNDTIPLTVEGISFPNKVNLNGLVNPKFTKCSFSNLGSTATINNMNGLFINCIINVYSNSRSNNTTFINSVIWDAYSITNDQTVVLYNSIINSSNFSGLFAYNSIIIKRGSNYPNSTCTFTNCIGILISSYAINNPFGLGYTTGCVTYMSYADVFKTFNGNFTLDLFFIFDSFFALKDEMATGFLGNDGTQVGIYGGYVPYGNRPSYMVLKRCNVANKSTVDGKLSIDIEVITEDE